MNLSKIVIFTCQGLAKDFSRTNNIANIEEIGNFLTDLQDKPQRLTYQEQALFFDRYKTRMFEIAQVLRLTSRQNKKFRLKRNSMRPIDLIDKIMEPLFSYKTFMNKLYDFIATVMREFMKGITYFDRNDADERIDRPIYHRKISCGSRQNLHELNCSKFYEDPQEFFRRSTKNRTCTIERQVYDCLFAKYFPTQEQDFGHRMMLKMSQREDYFNKCFPSTTIEISVDFDMNGMPVDMSISQCSNVRISLETYSKKCNSYDKTKLNWNDIMNLDTRNVLLLYKDVVIGKRLVYDRTSAIKIFTQKEQTFKKPVDIWEQEHIEQMTDKNVFSNTAIKNSTL